MALLNRLKITDCRLLIAAACCLFAACAGADTRSLSYNPANGNVAPAPSGNPFTFTNAIVAPRFANLTIGTNTFEFRNGTTGQNVYVYNTYTSGANYERGVFGWGTNTLYIGEEHAGHVADRDVVFLRNGTPFVSLKTSSYQLNLLTTNGIVTTGSGTGTLAVINTSAGLRGVLSDETGSGGAAVFATAPTLDAAFINGNLKITRTNPYDFSFEILGNDTSQAVLAEIGNSDSSAHLVFGTDASSSLAITDGSAKAGFIGTDNSTALELVTNSTARVKLTSDLLQMHTTSTSDPRGIESLQISTTIGGRVNIARSRGTFGSPAAVQTSDVIGKFMFRAHDGTNFIDTASVDAQVVGTVGTGRVATQVDIYTSTDETTSQRISAVSFDKAQRTILHGTLRVKGYTVATLPTGTVGDVAYVTDAAHPTYLAPVTGGSDVVCPVFYDGVNWITH